MWVSMVVGWGWEAVRSLWRENGRVWKSGERLAGIMCGVGVGCVCGCVCGCECV